MVALYHGILLRIRSLKYNVLDRRVRLSDWGKDLDRAPRAQAAVAGRNPAIPSVKIVGGGLAGLAAAAKLGATGFEVDLHEARPFLGGRATSFPVNPAEADSPRIDNCQHVLLRCFDALLDFYRRCGVEDKIRFYDRLYFVRPGGRRRYARTRPLADAVPFHRLAAVDEDARLGRQAVIDPLPARHPARAAPAERSRPDHDAAWLREKKATPAGVREVLAPAAGQRR